MRRRRLRTVSRTGKAQALTETPPRIGLKIILLALNRGAWSRRPNLSRPATMRDVMNFARIAVGAAVLLTLSAPCAEAARAHVTGGVDLRQGPSSGYPVIAFIPVGSIVDIGGCRGRW